jgi:glycerol-3-phosphate O-acyltransferase/dihydroxyacetone phosphate acyltransferase
MLTLMRRILTALLRVITNVFFPRIEVVGSENVPAEGGVIFAVNHPNALVDPLFLLALAPRPVSFLAKAPLFRYPLIGFFARTFDSIPVYRKGDPGADLSRNAETFANVNRVLTGGGAIAIFPEGTTHSDSMLKTLKTGAARMALIAAAAASQPVRVVPTGIYYSAKKAFRSAVLISFGEPLIVQGAALEADGEPGANRVAALTRRIEDGLSHMTLQADSRAALSLVARAERIFRSVNESDDSLAAELEMRRQFVAAYAFARERMPVELATVESHIAQFESELRESGLLPHDLDHMARRSVQPSATWILSWSVLLPLAIAGTILHYPLYRLIAFLGVKLAHGEEELIATIKLIAGLVFFPLLWIALALIVGRWEGARWAIVTLIAAPLSAYAALRLSEHFDRFIGRARAVSGAMSGSVESLLSRRRAIRSEMLTIAAEMQKAAGQTTATVWPPVGNDLL